MNSIMKDTGVPTEGDYYSCITFIPKRPEDETWIVFRYGGDDECTAVC